jgi:hypothetical protein
VCSGRDGKFVIPTEVFIGLRPTKVLKNGFNSASALHLDSATALHEGATLAFVIPSEAEGSAVRRPFRGNVFRQSVA